MASSELLPLLLTSSIAMFGEVISEVVVLATLSVESLISGGLIRDLRMLRLYEVSRIDADLMGI